MSEEQKAAREAVARLEPAETLTLQMAVVFSAVRALINAHPEPDSVRANYDQLMGQFMAGPATAGYPDKAVVLRDLTATLFAPPVVLDM